MAAPDEDASVKPMGALAAAMWACIAQLMFLWILQLSMALRESAGYDLIGRIICQVAGYGLTFYLLLRFYAPEARIRDFAALAPSKWWFYPLGLGLGVSATFPTYWVLALILERFPPPAEDIGWLDLFYDLSRPEQVAVAAGTVLVGPFVEELIFRGALFRTLGQAKRPAVVVGVTAILFAAVHLDLQRYPPLLFMGALLGLVRWASGSLIPPLLLHMSFNALPFVDLLRYPERPPDDGADELSLGLVAGSALVCAALIAATWWLRPRDGAARD